MSTVLVPSLSSVGDELPDGRRLLGSRPGRLRLIASAVVVAIVAAGVIGFIVATQVISSTDRIQDSTGPVLIGTQQMFASLAEADAAATAVHLSGADGDREQRALYERALARSSSSLENVARLVGDDDVSHAAMASIAQSLTRYAGLIESSRVRNEQGLPGADEELLQAIALVREDISAQVAVVTSRVQERLDDEISAGAVYPAMAVYFLAVAVLIAGMVYLASRFRRLLNPPLVLAAVATLGVAVWFGYAYFDQQSALKNARDGGYESIALTSQIQSKAFQYKADESLALISGTFIDEAPRRAGLAAEIMDSSNGLIVEVQRVADAPREDAAAEEMRIRWDRYWNTGFEIQAALQANEPDLAAEIAAGVGSSTFTGFNTSVESVLSDNQNQFQLEVTKAGDALGYLRWVVIGGAVIAALLAWSGFALRVREYQ